MFRQSEGYVCIASNPPAGSESRDLFRHSFFEWPKQKRELVEYIDVAARAKNVWFGVSLVDSQRFIKENCLPGVILWADFDENVDLSTFDPPPSCVVRSSEKGRHAYWRLNQRITPQVAENLSRRLAYKLGADKSGWDMVQLLRVPFTMNFKYDPPQLVEIETVQDSLYDPKIFEAIPFDEKEYVKEHAREIPEFEDLPDATDVIFKFFQALSASPFMELYNNDPVEDDDWSKRLWRLINICFEVGMSAKEAFSVALAAKCNKYKRDHRPNEHLWKEVVKVEAKQKQFNVNIDQIARLTMPQLVKDVEMLGFIREYRDWAQEATDAIPTFHDLSCFILMSALMSHSIKLETSFGNLYMNLWGLIIGDSTLSRKTTAMKMAMDMVYDIDESLILASDGSVEGLLTGLSNRPGRVSIFYKDEVTGLFDSMNRKDYLAGMPETLTLLYDVPKVLPRLLRRETITVHSPYFIFFGGGIRDRVYSLLSDEYVLSGFLPRFLVVSGDANIQSLRRTGPANGEQSGRIKILNRASEIYHAFTKTVDVKLGTQVTQMPVHFDARLTPKAWERFGEMEYLLVDTANKSHHRMLALPTFQRLAFSALKMAVLIAASQNGPDNANRIHVDVNHLNLAAWFIQDWGTHSIDMFTNAGQTNVERLIGKVYNSIRNSPGVTKSEVMRNQKLTSKEMKDVITTLYDRGLVIAKEVGRGARLYPTDHGSE